MRPTALVALCLFAAAANAQDVADAGPSVDAADAGATGVLTKAPTLQKQVEAKFPDVAVDAGFATSVLLEVDIGADGKVMDARVTRSAGEAFDASALEAVKQFEFTPAEVDGKPAPVRIQYELEFFMRPQVIEAPIAEHVVNFAGTLLERGTRRPIPNATVAVGEGDARREATSGADGRFELQDVPAGAQKVVVAASDYARYEVSETIAPGQRTEVTYYVRRKVYSAFETVVHAPRERKDVAQISLKQEEIRLIPGTQGDALRVVQNLPGVARAPFSVGVLVVRGGKPWDTRVYVDDAYIPLLFHFGGLFATFNSNLVDEIDFEPGGFSSEYGRSIGGLVRAYTRTPSQNGYHGYVDINLIDSSLLLEGPIDDKWSFAIAGRRSYIDVTLPAGIDLVYPAAKKYLSFTEAPRYYDYQLKVERKTAKDRFSVMFFGSNDALGLALPNPAYDPEGRGEFDTLLLYNRLNVNYERHLGPNLDLVTHNVLGFDKVEFNGGSDIHFTTTILPVMAREQLAWHLPELKLTVEGGFDGLYLPYSYLAQTPPPFKLNQIPDPFVSRQLLREEASQYTFEPALFVDAIWKPLERLKLVGGVRADYDSLMHKGWIDVRSAAFFSLDEATSLKASAGLFHQPPDYRQGQLSATFGNPDLLPEAAEQFSFGGEHRFTDAISLDVQLYYKWLFHQAQPTVAFQTSTDASGNVVDLHYTSTGLGRSYGAEILLRHQLTKNFFGWISYSLSRAERLYPGAYGWGLHPLDQPHNLIAIASYKLPYDFIAGVRVRYASGALNTPYLGAIYDANGNYYYPLFGQLFSRRLPDFFQLDVRLDKRFVYERWMLSVYLDVQNATNHGNVEGVIYNYDYTKQQYIYSLPILPDLGIRGEW